MGYIKRKSAKQEALTAKEFGGRVTPASGALTGAKGDVRTADFLIENKYTDADSYKMELKTWKKIDNEALRDGMRVPMMQIDIQDLQLVMVDYEYFKGYLSEGNHVSITYFNTPHKSMSMKKKDFEYLKYEPSSLVLSFGAIQLAVMEKNQYFLLDK